MWKRNKGLQVNMESHVKQSKIPQWHRNQLNAANETEHARLQLNIQNIFTLLKLNRRQEFDICSRGTLPVTQHPAASYWPYTPDASRKKVGIKQTPLHMCVFPPPSSSLNSQPPNLSRWVQLSDWFPKPDGHSATPAATTQTQTTVLGYGGCNQLNLSLAHTDPSITETEVKLLTLWKRYCLTPPTLSWFRKKGERGGGGGKTNCGRKWEIYK